MRKQDSYEAFLIHSPSIQADWAGLPSWFEDGQPFIGPTEWNMPFSPKRYAERLRANENYLVVLELLAVAKQITVDGTSCLIEADPRYDKTASENEGRTFRILFDQPLERLRRDVPYRKRSSIEDLIRLERSPS